MMSINEQDDNKSVNSSSNNMNNLNKQVTPIDSTSENNGNNDKMNKNENESLLPTLVIATNDFIAHEYYQLDIKKDELLIVTDWNCENEGWVYGHRKDNKEEKGMFPKYLVKKYNDENIEEHDLKRKLLFAESLTSTLIIDKDNDHSDNMDEKSKTINSTKGKTYGNDNNSVSTTSNITTVQRHGISDYGAHNTVSINNERNWDDEGCWSFSHFREIKLRYPCISEDIKDYNNYSLPIKPVPLDYYRFGVYMYITNPVIVQTRTMMERMFSAHTLYTITVKLLRPNLPMYRNNNICTFTVHKRYRQFKSFYMEIHNKYKDKINYWPKFPKKAFFNRFESNIIEERAVAFTKLMSFISLHPYLYNCPVLLNFLEITGSMNNSLVSINSNISNRGNYQLENSSDILKGITIPFEGRDITPFFPRLYTELSTTANRATPKKMNNIDRIDSTDSIDSIITTYPSIPNSPINSNIKYILNILDPTATIISNLPDSNQNSKLKRKAVLNDETIEEKFDLSFEDSDSDSDSDSDLYSEFPMFISDQYRRYSTIF